MKHNFCRIFLLESSCCNNVLSDVISRATMESNGWKFDGFDHEVGCENVDCTKCWCSSKEGCKLSEKLCGKDHWWGFGILVIQEL